jgi:hypothetical protein
MHSSTFIIIVLAMAAWILLNRWVLPWLGIPTCMSGCCSASPTPGEHRRAASAQADRTGSSNSNVPE